LKMHQMLWLMWLHQTRVVAPGATLGLLAQGIAIYCSHDAFISTMIFINTLFATNYAVRRSPSEANARREMPLF